MINQNPKLLFTKEAVIRLQDKQLENLKTGNGMRVQEKHVTYDTYGCSTTYPPECMSFNCSTTYPPECGPTV
jgi:hypothetical protein